MINLKKEYLTIVKNILSKHVPHSIVWAYGSRVTGGCHEGSDLDLVIIDPQNPTLHQENLFKLKDVFSESELPILVDVMDWALIPESFKEKIKEKYEVLQNSSH